MWTEAGEHSALCLAQMKLENDFARTGIIIQPEDGNPLSLRPWIEDPRAVRTGDVIDWKTRKRVRTLKVPPYAVGAVIASDGGMFLRFDDPAMCVREWRRRIADDPGYKHGVYLPAKSLRDFLNIYAPPGDTHPVTGLPNENTKYYEVVTTMLERFAAMEADDTSPDPQPDPQEGNDMPTYRTVIPGLPGGPLETSFPVKLMIVPAWRTNNRPGIKARTPRLSVQHETANSGTYAAAEANYLYNGAGGRQASWHFTVDDREGYVTIPVDEVAWQAGDGSGPGNYNGVACELAVHRDIVNNPTRRAQSQKNAAELMGKVGARLNATPPARQHANFMNKNCPAQMRNRGESNRYVDWWHHFYQMEKAAMDGKPAPEQPVFYIGDTIKALVPLNLRQRAGTGNVPVIATLPVGTQAVINGPFEWKDGYGWLPVETSYGNGFVAMGENGVLWIEKVKDRPAPQPEPEPEPEPEPQYVPARPIPALLETDLKKYDTAEGITTDDLGQDFIFVADVIEFTKDTVAAQFAVKNPKPVKAPYHAGDRAIAAWLVKSQDTDSWWYVLAGGDDEWVRVPYANTKRVSDAPLLPGQEWGESEEADVSDVINALKDVLDDSAQ